MSSPELTVHRHVVTCRVVGTAATGDQALRQVLRDDVLARLEEAVDASAADGYWVIRRLELAAELGAHWTSGQVGGALARTLASELDRRTVSRTDPEALFFPDRATFVAQYLADLAGGRVAGRWEYAQFARLGSALQAVETLARAEPETLVPALLLLRPTELAQLARLIPPTMAERLLASLAGQSAIAEPALVLPAVQSLRASGRLAADGAALLLAVTAARDHGAPLGSVAGPAVAVAALLAHERRSEGGWSALVAHLRQGAWASAARIGGPDVVLQFVRWSEPERAGLSAALAPVTAPQAAEGRRVSTPFGGAFLLLPLLDELWDWCDATRTWPPVEATSPDAAARLVAVAAALGHARSASADEVLRLAVGGCATDVGGLAAWTATLRPEHVRAFEEAAGDRLAEQPDEHTRLGSPFPPTSGADVLARSARSALTLLARMLPGMAAASTPYLRDNLLDFPAWVQLGEPTVVELGSPPLSVLVSLAGLDRGELVVGPCGHPGGARGEEARRWLLTPPR